MVVSRSLLVCLMALGLAGEVSAKGWPQPAAGDSPDGQVQIVLTFDDGPNPVTTPQVLDILKAHNLKAIFFLVGEMVESRDKRVPKILERMLAEGHVIANHTQRHKDLCRVTEEKAIEDLDKGKETIERVTHVELAWLRLPFGVRCDRVDRMLEERKVKHFHWDLDPQEWKHGKLDKTVNYVTKELSRAGGRAVLLLHDVKKVTVEALPEILKWIDEENARREKSRKMKIEIMPAPDLAAEQLPKGLLPWLADATAGARTLPTVLASLLP
jgi:peptidoglycan/xylan/chitin deacetylase (PgdA/CDA1 family)